MTTVIELVKEYFPSATDEIADAVLWECTGFPGFFTGPGTPEECLRRQLAEAAAESGGDPHKAMQIAWDEMDECMKRCQARQDIEDMVGEFGSAMAGMEINGPQPQAGQP